MPKSSIAFDRMTDRQLWELVLNQLALADRRLSGYSSAWEERAAVRQARDACLELRVRGAQLSLLPGA